MQIFPPLAQPLPVVPVDASGSVHPFLLERQDWLKGFLQTIMSQEDHEKYKTAFGPATLKEEVPLWPTKPKSGAV